MYSTDRQTDRQVPTYEYVQAGQRVAGRQSQTETETDKKDRQTEEETVSQSVSWPFIYSCPVSQSSDDAMPSLIMNTIFT